MNSGNLTKSTSGIQVLRVQQRAGSEKSSTDTAWNELVAYLSSQDKDLKPQIS